MEFRAGHIDGVLTKDTFIALPKGIPHFWINTSTGNAKLITFTAGAGNEGFFLTLGAPGRPAGGTSGNAAGGGDQRADPPLRRHLHGDHGRSARRCA